MKNIKKIELEKQFKDMEFKFNYSQINPRFLFNALNIAGRQAYLESAKKTEEIIYSLAEMYRYYLKDSKCLISIDEEVKNLKNYFFIQQSRFGEQLKFDVQIDKQILKYKIPALSLEVFIENAVYHGLEPKEDFGLIRLSCSIQNETLYFEIFDNGVGISEETLHLLNNKNFEEIHSGNNDSNSIHNVYKRFQYFFPNNFNIDFQSSHSTGTCVTLSIPALL